VKTSDALRRWRTAHHNACGARRSIDLLGVGPNPTLAALYYADLDKWTAERDRLYALLTPADKATADRIAKETTP
jgi:hypothetical protein